MTTEGHNGPHNGPPPGWPDAPAPAAGEFGPGMTVVPDEPNYVPPGEAASEYGSTPFGEVPPTKTYVEPFPAAQVLGPPAYDPGPAYAQIQAPRQASSRAPLIVGALAIAVGIAGTVGFITYRQRSAAESEESVPAIDVPKEKKKIAPAEATAPAAAPAATTTSPSASAAPSAATTEPTATAAAPVASAAPTATTPATAPQPTATVPPKPTATVPPKPTATTPPKPTATAPPPPTSTAKRRIPR